MLYKRDFDTVYIRKEGDINIREEIKNLMEENGYDTKTCDICSVDVEDDDGVFDVIFKFVHHSTPTMEKEPYFHVRFVNENDL